MRALAISGRDATATLQDLPVPEPASEQVRVRVAAASVNGFDSGVAAGFFWDVVPHTFPVVLGRDVAGTVEALGEGVSGLAVGDRVAGVLPGPLGPIGAIAEAVSLPATALTPVPAAVSDEQAAAVGLAGVTALDLLTALDVSADDTLLVSGATGGVGALLVQLAVARGARVLATARPGEAQDFVRKLGADAVLDHTADLVAAAAILAPEGISAVAHAAGDAATLGRLLRPGGRLASVLGASAEQVGRDDVAVIPVGAKGTAAKVADLLSAVAEGRLQVPVAQTYALADAASALDSFRAGKLGKVVITA